MPDIDFKCLWKSNEEGNTHMKCGRVVINRGDSSGCGRFQLFLDVKTNGPKQTLKLEDVTDVVHRGLVLKVTLKNGVVITINEDPKRRNGHTMFDLDNTFKTAKYQNKSPDSMEPSTPKRQVLGDNRLNGNLQATPSSDWLYTSPQQPQSSDRVTRTPVHITPRRPFLSEFSDWPVSLGENSPPSRLSSRSDRQAVLGRRSDEFKLIDSSAERPYNSRKRLSSDMYTENDDFGENELAVKHSTPDSKLLSKLGGASDDSFRTNSLLMSSNERQPSDKLSALKFYKSTQCEPSLHVPRSLDGTTPPSAKRVPGLLSASNSISNRTKTIMQNSSQVNNGKKDGNNNKSPKPQITTSAGSDTALTLNKAPTVLRGFNNLGNTCYMNAILQSLFNLVAFSTDLLNSARMLSVLQLSDDSTADKTLFKAMVDLVRSQLRVRSIFDNRDQILTNLKRAISSSARRFSGHQQHDAHEFLCQLLDQLKEEVCEKSAKDEGTPCTNPTVDNFEFTIKSNLKCDRCGHTVTKDELYHDLSVDYPRCRHSNYDSASIQDAVDAYFQPVSIEFTCDSCQCKTATLTNQFVKLPRVLIVHLKRYSFNAVIGRHRKDRRKIFIPKFISLQDQCCSDTMPACSLPTPHDAYKAIKLSTTPKDKPSIAKSPTTSIFDKVMKPVNDAPQKLNSDNNEAQDPVKFGDFRLSHLTEEEQFEMALAESRKLQETQETEADLLDQIDLEHQTNHPSEDPCDRFNTSNGMNGDSLVPYDEHNVKVASHLRVRARRIRSEDSSPLKYSTSSCENDVDMAGTDKLLGDAAQSPVFSYRISNPNGNDDSIEIGRNDRRTGNRDQAVPSLSTSPVSGPFAGQPSPFKSPSVLDGCGELEECGRSLTTPDDSSSSNGVTTLFADDKENVLPPDVEIGASSENDQHGTNLTMTMDDQYEDDFEKACRLSLLEYEAQHQTGEPLLSTDDQLDEQEEELIIAEVDKAEKYELTRKNAETGELPYSYQLCSVVSHLGDSSFAGHYISEAYDVTKSRWLTFDDSSVNVTTDQQVRKQRDTTGYIFFYCSRELIDDLEGFFKDKSSQQNKNSKFTFRKKLP